MRDNELPTLVGFAFHDELSAHHAPGWCSLCFPSAAPESASLWAGRYRYENVFMKLSGPDEARFERFELCTEG